MSIFFANDSTDYLQKDPLARGHIMKINLQKKIVPDHPLCNSQVYPVDPFICKKKLWCPTVLFATFKRLRMIQINLTVPFATRWPAEVKKLGQKARSGMYQYETLMYKYISFI